MTKVWIEDASSLNLNRSNCQIAYSMFDSRNQRGILNCLDEIKLLKAKLLTGDCKTRRPIQKLGSEDMR